MLLMNQDRDISILFNPRFDELTAIPVGFKGLHMAYNIWCRDVMLGTFDTRVQAQAEINRIMNCPHEMYLVSGHSEWEQWEQVKEAMRNE